MKTARWTMLLLAAVASACSGSGGVTFEVFGEDCNLSATALHGVLRNNANGDEVSFEISIDGVVSDLEGTVTLDTQLMEPLRVRRFDNCRLTITALRDGTALCAGELERGCGSMVSANSAGVIALEPLYDCGDDTCEPEEENGACVVDCPVCGDGICSLGEDVADLCSRELACAADCATCGDGFCDNSETVVDCPSDCPACGDGVCDAAAGENCHTCSDCVPGCRNCAPDDVFRILLVNPPNNQGPFCMQECLTADPMCPPGYTCPGDGPMAEMGVCLSVPPQFQCP